MDASNLAVIASIIVAIVAIVPGVAALINQGKNDAVKAKLDMQTATLAMLEPLQKEVERLNKRIVELEQALITKTKEYGELMQENITKDSEILTMKYNMEGLQRKLDAVYPRRKTKPKEEEEVSTALEEGLKTNEARMEDVKNYVKQSVTEIENKSISNGIHKIDEGEIK